MSEDPPLVRQWILLRKLATHRCGLTVREMAREMEVAEKTIRRDLDQFRSLGMPLREEVAQRGCKRWCLPALLPEAQLRCKRTVLPAPSAGQGHPAMRGSRRRSHRVISPS